MSLSKMPPEVLSSVLLNRALPLPKRFRLRLASSRWSDIIDEGFTKESTLVLREQIIYYRPLQADHLMLKSGDLTQETIHLLARLFPGLTALTVIFWKHTNWSQVASLITHLPANLSTVKLFGTFDWRECIPVKPIAEALATLSQLDSLTLDADGLSHQLVPLLGTVLPRLVKFACSSFHFDTSIFSSSLSARCTHLLLHYDVFTSFSNAFYRKLASTVTHLHLVYCFQTDWQSICKLNRLTSLALHYTCAPMDLSLFHHLVSFTDLTQVRLFNLCYRTPFSLPSEEESAMSALSNIKCLTFSIDFKSSHVDFGHFFRTIRAWFPTLNHFTLYTNAFHHSAIKASFGQAPFSVDILSDEELLAYRETTW